MLSQQPPHPNFSHGLELLRGEMNCRTESCRKVHINLKITLVLYKVGQSKAPEDRQVVHSYPQDIPFTNLCYVIIRVFVSLPLKVPPQMV